MKRKYVYYLHTQKYWFNKCIVLYVYIFYKLKKIYIFSILRLTVTTSDILTEFNDIKCVCRVHWVFVFQPNAQTNHQPSYGFVVAILIFILKSLPSRRCR